jgi:hypothetical protein
MADKIDSESAELMFQQFCDDWHIKDDISKLNAEDMDTFNQAKDRIIEAFESGNLEIVDTKTLEYKFIFAEELNCQSVKIRRPRGATYMEADAGKKDDNMKKMFYMLSEMTGKSAAFYSKVDAVDIKTIMAVTSLFFGS